MYIDEERSWLEIDLSALKYNIEKVRKLLPVGTKILGVVKADAYGHGAVRIAQALEEFGADYLGVACIYEAIELREAGIKLPILIFGYTTPLYTQDLIKYDITQSLSSLEDAKLYSLEAEKCGAKLKVHVALDTGMGRVGFFAYEDSAEKSAAEIASACKLSGIEVTGVFSHFAVSDSKDADSTAYTKQQIARYRSVVELTEAKLGKSLGVHHLAAGGGIAYFHDEAHFDMVRMGIVLYGAEQMSEDLGLKPVMSLKSKIAMVREYEAGTDIGYGRTYTTKTRERIGIVPVGYADGLIRTLGNKAVFYSPEGDVRQVGKVCMDMCMVNLTDLPGIVPGSEIEVFGPNASINKMAKIAGTIPYEIYCNVSGRLPKIYK